MTEAEEEQLELMAAQELLYALAREAQQTIMNAAVRVLFASNRDEAKALEELGQLAPKIASGEVGGEPMTAAEIEAALNAALTIARASCGFTRLAEAMDDDGRDRTLH
jgi:hypothetical protein